MTPTRHDVAPRCVAFQMLAALFAVTGATVAQAGANVDSITTWLKARSISIAESWEHEVATADRPSRLAQPLLAAVAEADPRFASIAAQCPAEPPEWLVANFSAEDLSVAASFRLAVAEELWRQRRGDACSAWLDGVEGLNTFSPALCWYLRALVAHQAVDDSTAVEALAELDAITSAADVDPFGAARRWVIEALRGELAKEPKPTTDIARRMRDAQRGIARRSPAEATRRRHEAILKALDELIDKLEKQQQQQQQQQAAAAGQATEPGRAADESRPSDLKGAGEVDPKRLVAGDDWGSLPPAERERLTQAITRDFPPHYRALVEGYFRTLAEQPESPQQLTKGDSNP